jgi:hypothetical protein
MVDSFAAGCGFFPVAGFSKVLDPPGKGAALDGTGCVDGALVVFQKDAVVSDRLFEECVLAIDIASVFAEELFARKVVVCGEGGYVFFGEVDIAG